MKCPECVEAGERSTVRLGAETTTLLTLNEFYDEDGNFHRHDPNVITRTNSCSRGHLFEERWRRPCPTCGKGTIAWREAEGTL